MTKIKHLDADAKSHLVTGKVAILYGTVKAISPDGTARILKVNSPIFADDHIITGADGSVSIVFNTFPPTQLDLGRVTDVVIDEDIYGAISPDVVADATAQQEAIQAILMEGDQPVELDPTAAGVEESAGGGHSIFVVNPDWIHVTPESGAETRGVTWGAAAEKEFALIQEENSPPSIIVNTGNAEGGPDTVYESGLNPDGSNAAADSEYAYGSFTISDPDGLDDIAGVTINGVFIPIGDLGSNNEIPGQNGYGNLIITSYNPDTGEAEYQYELTGPTPGEGLSDSFTLTVTDQGGLESDPATITFNIADDLPSATGDIGSITEDATPAYITGDVLANDTFGADQPIKAFSWGSTEAQYGTFEDTGDGTYKYTLNNANPAVDGLKAGETLEETFSYSFTDADGDVASAELKITIYGANDGPHITTNPGTAQGEPDTVYESGLAAGSAATADTEFAQGTFTVSDPDGLDDIAGVTINGTYIPIEDLAGSTVDTALGTLSITAYDGTTGEASYTYELKSATTDVEGADETDSFTLTVTDQGGLESDPATITFNIADDAPTAFADVNAVTEGAVISGNVLTDGTPDIFGADGPAATTPAGGVVGVRAAGGDTTTPVVTGVDTIINGLYGTLTLKADGSYIYDGKPDAVASSQSDVFVYTIKDADGDLSTATLTINLTDSGLVAPDDNDVTVYEKALDTLQDGNDLAASTYTGSIPRDAGETDAVNQLTAAGGTGPYTYELVGSPTGSYGTIQINADGSYIYTLTKPYDTTPEADNGMHTEENKESFTYKVTDANGNTAQGTITVNIVDDIPTALPKEHDLNILTPATTAVISNLAAGWVEPFDANIDTKTNTDADPYFEKIEWGGQLDGKYVSSNYVYVDNASLVNVDVGETFTLGTFTHNNFPIPSGSAISTAYLKVTFDVLIDGQTIHVDHVVEFQHNETPNDGTHPDDIVTIVNGTNEAAVVTPEGFKYTLKLGFQDAEGNTVITVDTKENASNTFNLNATLAADADYYVPPVTGTVDANFGADGPGDLMVVSVAHDANGDGTPEIYNTSSPGYDPATKTLTIETHEGATFSVNFATGQYTYTPSSATGASEVISYTVKDADGDTASSILKFNLPAENMLVVGTNVDDQVGQNIDHYIDKVAPFDGPITGDAGHDVLVGDMGGSSISGKILNLSLVLDSSGSMTENITFNGKTMTRMDALKLSVKDMLNDLAASQAVGVRVQIVDFDTNSVQLGVYDLKDSAELAAALKAVDGLVAGGGTNYEAGLQKSLAWANSTGADAPLTGGNVINQVIFISDGEPTYYYKGDATTPGSYNQNLGGDGYNFTQEGLNQILISGNGDTVAEVVALEAKGFTIEAVGINVTPLNLDHLNQVEGEAANVNPDAATNITTGEQLSQVLADLTLQTNIAPAGNDHITGGDGNDIIFGDSVNTDVLAQANGLDTPDGAGWSVFEKLGWTEQRIMDYIENNHSTLATESGRSGGNDVIDGGAGNDIIYGQEGNDIISGGTGNNILSGGTGADTFIVSTGAHDTILDYSHEQGDKLDLTSVWKSGEGDSAVVSENPDHTVKLEILDSSHVEKASVTFENIHYSDLTPGHELDSLLGKVDIDHS
ncbi:MAG TPA: VCBS domain-containing protein [Smithella sp.]|nr:VCBS domain-containing protein [Smithella sp.]